MSEQRELFPEEPIDDSQVFVTVAKVGDIPVGEGRPFTVGNRVVAVFCAGKDYYAIDDFCPHQGASLAGGFLGDGNVACPWHYWRFSARDGRWLDSPRIRIDAFDVRIVGDEIQVATTPRKAIDSQQK
ncbi:MAG: Rieske 2Fe-2S domain-containing protein [Pirellulales bacterium]